MMSDERKLGIAPGEERWRWDLNPRKGCPFTRFRGVRPRPLGDSTAAEPTRAASASASRRLSQRAGCPFAEPGRSATRSGVA